jgi:hypothetical protein
VDNLDHPHLPHPSRPSLGNARISGYQHPALSQCNADQLVITVLLREEGIISHHSKPLGQPAHVDIDNEARLLHLYLYVSAQSVQTADRISSSRRKKAKG